MNPIKMLVLDPGHFHAALVQKKMYPEISARACVYAPLGYELLDYLNRITGFNNRPDHPTSWELEISAGPDFLPQLLQNEPGNVVIIAGRSRPKMERIEACVKAGFHVLVDKPWIIASADLPRLSDVLDEAEKKNVVAYDIMTERHEITSILQRELVNDEGVFGSLLSGTQEDPAVSANNVHHIMKMVSGMPIRRPWWFFDVTVTGEGLADVGTHVIDLVQWTTFPDKPLDYRRDVAIVSAKQWPTVISQAQFEQVTGEREIPQQLTEKMTGGDLQFQCNNAVQYTLQGTHVRIRTSWDWKAPEGVLDFYEASFCGSSSRIELCQGEEQRYVPELYVVPNSASVQSKVFENLRRKVGELNAVYPGLALEESNGKMRLVIPDQYRASHEAHFAQVTEKFFEYVKSPSTLPGWEKSNMLLKYFISTTGSEMAHQER
jgi:predicted dehydrogenase